MEDVAGKADHLWPLLGTEQGFIQLRESRVSHPRGVLEEVSMPHTFASLTSL